jgi:hypothetical protein
MSFLDKLMGVVKIAAPVAANLILPGSGGIVGGLMNSVLQSNGYSESQVLDMTEEKKAEIIQKNPELLVDLKAKANELEATLAAARNENAGQVNQQMAAELSQGKWYQKAWRPFIGFMFPLTVIGVYVGLPVANAMLPGIYITAEVPEVLWIGWLACLGVATHGRNQQKLQAGGTNPTSLIGGLINKFK